MVRVGARVRRGLTPSAETGEHTHQANLRISLTIVRMYADSQDAGL